MIGKLLATLAKESGKTQIALAEAAGVSRLTINRFFNEHTEVRASDLMDIMRALDIKVDEAIQARFEEVRNAIRK